MRLRITSLKDRVLRTKNLPSGGLETKLKRNLTTFDITLLGVGHMIGAGIYVLTGAVVLNTAGPSIVISFLLAGLASLLSALCYAEFGARFPKAGSAYTYAYVGVGELWAFIIGWNIVLEHMLGAAAVARSWSGYLNSLTGDSIQNFTMNKIGTFGQAPMLGKYPDFVAFLAVVVVGGFIALGSKSSTIFNNIFTCINIVVIAVVVVYGLTFANFKLWTGTNPVTHVSNFFPYGIGGTFAGAASCFFAYIGFDGLATAGEEAKNPSRSIPFATFISMTIVTLAYVLMSASLTLMVPYNEVVPAAAFSFAFDAHGATVARIAVSVGALCGMTTSLVGSLFALPRCIYAMADDGLMFSILAKVNQRTMVPVNAVIFFTLLTALIALLFDIETLVEFLSIGTLLAYTIVSACIIILRYKPGPVGEGKPGAMDNGGRLRYNIPGKAYIDQMEPGSSVTYALVVMTIFFFGFGICFTSGFALHGVAGPIIVAILGVVVLICFAFIALHHQNSTPLAFKVQFVPLLPAASMCINIMMMLNLAPVTWLRLAIWMAIGFAIYLGYGIRHSKEEHGMAEQLNKSTTYDSVLASNIAVGLSPTEKDAPGGGLTSSRKNSGYAYSNDAMSPESPAENGDKEGGLANTSGYGGYDNKSMTPYY